MASIRAAPRWWRFHASFDARIMAAVAADMPIFILDDFSRRRYRFHAYAPQHHDSNNVSFAGNYADWWRGDIESEAWFWCVLVTRFVWW